jgi:hypothetical protein
MIRPDDVEEDAALVAAWHAAEDALRIARKSAGKGVDQAAKDAATARYTDALHAADTAQLAIHQDLVARQAAAEPGPFAEYLGHAVDAICGWAKWHRARAIARGFGDGKPYAEIARAASALLSAAVDEIEGDGSADDVVATDDAVQALARAFSAALEATWDATEPADDPQDHQIIETEESPLHHWWQAFNEVVHCARKARIRPDEATQWQLRAAHYLVFNAPATVAQLEAAIGLTRRATPAQPIPARPIR